MPAAPAASAQTRHVLKAIQKLERKVLKIMATVEEITTLLTGLTTDLEGLATTALSEFAKLEKEVSEGKTPENLEPLKAAIEAIDNKVKSVVVPTT